ncbi:fatty acyl-AMP ligase [Streptomyces xanthophaeus]|uniref:fatty acyl-AMP ligase n=1 Tax=Streptomyces xanthophaeus TaxID=67385 RepID=UPI00364FE345
MAEPQTLAHALARHAETRADTTAIAYATSSARGDEGAEEALGYGELYGRALSLGAVLRSLPTRTHDRPFVLIALPNGVDYVSSFFACLTADAVAVTYHPPALSTARAGRAYDQRLAQILRDCEPSAIIARPQLHQRLRKVADAAGLAPLILDPRQPGTTDGPSGAGGRDAPLARPDHLALLQYTSGSTSDPKGVMVSHANLVHNVRGMTRSLGTGPGQAAAGWLPLFHDMGLIGMICHPIWAGMSVHMSTPADFLRNPLGWLRTLTRTRATVTFAPDFGYATAVHKVPEDRRAGLDLSGLRHALSGAEPVRPHTVERFAKEYAPYGFDPHAMMPAYGLAEATLVVSCLDRQAAPAFHEVSAEALGKERRAEAPDGSRQAVLVGCGRSLAPDTEIAIVDPSTAVRTAPGEVGEIWVSGPSVAGGYWGRPEDSARVFGARPEPAAGAATGAGRTYLRTGDLGVWYEGQLCVVGRIKDVIVHRGTNHYPQDLEATVESCHPAPVRAAALSVPEPDHGAGGHGGERIVVVTELTAYGDDVDYDAIAQAVRSAVLEEHGIPLAAVALLKAGAVPRTTSGKVRRQEGVRRWNAGEFKPVAEWRRERTSEGGHR